MNEFMRSVRRLFGSSRSIAPSPLTDEQHDDIAASLRNRVDSAMARQVEAFAQLQTAASEAQEVAVAAIRHLEDRGDGSREHRQ